MMRRFSLGQRLTLLFVLLLLLCAAAYGLYWMLWASHHVSTDNAYTAVEVATAAHVREALAYDVDMLWIGARTSANPFAVQEVADALEGMDIPVLIKNPVNPDIDLWIGAIERIHNAGIRRINDPEAAKQAAQGKIVDPKHVYFATVAKFETYSPQYKWLEESIFICYAVRLPDRVLLKFYQVK